MVGAQASGIRSSFAIIVQDRLSGMQTPRGVSPPALALSKFDVVPEFRGPLPEILVVSLIKQDVTGVTCCRLALM